MGKQFLYGLIFCLIIIGMFWLYMFTTTDRTNERVALEVESAMKSALIGKARLGIDGGMNKQEAIANLVYSIVQSQKNHGQDIKIDYVLLNENNQATTNDDDIDSIQYRVTIQNERWLSLKKQDGSNVKGESIAESRIELNFKDSKRSASGDTILERRVEFPFSTSAYATRSGIVLPGAKEILSVVVESGGGNVTHTFDQANESISLTVNNGELREIAVGGELVQADTKILNSYELPSDLDPLAYPVFNFDGSVHTNTEEPLNGYKGVLTRFLLSGVEGKKIEKEYKAEDYYSPSDTDVVVTEPNAEGVGGHIRYSNDGYTGDLYSFGVKTIYQEEDVKWVEGLPTENYADVEGYSGTLPIMTNSGGKEYTVTMPISNYPFPNYPATEEQINEFGRIHGQEYVEAIIDDGGYEYYDGKDSAGFSGALPNVTEYSKKYMFSTLYGVSSHINEGATIFHTELGEDGLTYSGTLNRTRTFTERTDTVVVDYNYGLSKSVMPTTTTTMVTDSTTVKGTSKFQIKTPKELGAYVEGYFMNTTTGQYAKVTLDGTLEPVSNVAEATGYLWQSSNGSSILTRTQADLYRFSYGLTNSSLDSQQKFSSNVNMTSYASQGYSFVPLVMNDGEPKVFLYEETISEYYVHTFNDYYGILEAGINLYSGTVSATRNDGGTITFSGYVTRPELAKYDTYYQGFVEKYEDDTRKWAYRGNVDRPASDGRTFEKGYSYTVKIQYKK